MNFIYRLIRLANLLDQRGLQKEALLIDGIIANEFPKKFLMAVRDEMVDRSGDEEWSTVDLASLYKWVGSFDDVTEACDWLEADSVMPHHVN